MDKAVDRAGTSRRIQRKRTKGWRMPAGAVYVGRGSKWGNPYRLIDYHGEDGPLPEDEAREMAVREFDAALYVGMLDVSYADVRRELKGKDVACWCPLDKPCHADVLIEIANGGDHG